MQETLKGAELAALVERVFQLRGSDRAIAILVDLPDSVLPDSPAWAARRQMALGWVRELASVPDRLSLPVSLCLYRNVRTNNGDLPAGAWLWSSAEAAARSLPASADELDPGQSVLFDQVLSTHSVLLAPTQFSATAPLKLCARKHGFRAATMPGFSPEMIPALRLDYVEVNRRVLLLKGLLDEADAAEFVFVVDGSARHELRLDLRFRTAHASGGLLPEAGTAGNLPSGEAYVVPYEGEREGEPSRSAGELPVQFDDGLVVYRVQGNRATEVLGVESAAKARESDHLARERAYGNLAELGLGVLDDFGVTPTGEVLLDEKLGLHIAFGRSDHFGGTVGAALFSRPEAVVHIDRVFVRSLQPRISVSSVDLRMPDGRSVPLMRDDRYAISFG